LASASSASASGQALWQCMSCSLPNRHSGNTN
jgi:hypothetical protein